MYQFYSKHGGELLPTIDVVNKEFSVKCVFRSEIPSEWRIWKKARSEMQVNEMDALWMAMAGENAIFMCVHD